MPFTATAKRFRVDDPDKFRLSDHDPDERSGLTEDKSEAKAMLEEGTKRLSITDVSQTVRWNAGGGVSGPPSLHVEKSFQRGRVYQYSAQKELGVDAETGQLGMPVAYTFRSGEGRVLVREAAKRAGWSEKMGGEQLGAVIVAGSVVVIGVLVGLFFLIRALLG